MPELPEVESVRRKLEPLLLGRCVASVKTSKRNYAFLTPPEKLARTLTGKCFTGVERRGKYLLLWMGNPASLGERSGHHPPTGALLVHLGMTGQFFSQPGYMSDRHVHLTLTLDDTGGKRAKALQPTLVHYRDPRQFGKLAWLEAASVEHEPRLKKLGPDALDITGDALFTATRGRKASVKAVLLDQQVAAGIGNIYTDEALFMSGVRPARRASALKRAEADALARNIRNVLQRAIKAGGSSVNDYIHPDGSSGWFQIEHKVYDRAGQPCKTCGAPIKKSVVAQRGTHFCAKCQK